MSKKLFNTIVIILMVVGQFFAALPTGQVRAEEGYTPVTVADTLTTAEINALIAAAPAFTELIFDGEYDGPFNIPETATDLIFTLKDGTIINAQINPDNWEPDFAYCFDVAGDHITIRAESIGGAKLVGPAGYSGGIKVETQQTGLPAGVVVEDLLIENLEIAGPGGDESANGFGFYYSGNISGLRIINNYIHDFTYNISFDSTVNGTFIAQGNLLKNGLTNSSNLNFAYNSWGLFVGPTVGVDVSNAIAYTPWTHAAIDIQPDAAATIAVGDQVTFDVKGVFQNITSANFTLEYDPSNLQLTGITDETTAFTGGAFGLVNDDVAGTIVFDGYTGTAVSSETEAGTLLYKATFKALAAGEHSISIDPDNDLFGMMPPDVYSQNVYAASLDTESVNVVEPLDVTDVDLEISTAIDDTYFDLTGSLSAGYTVALDPTVQWHYFDTDVITSNRVLADGSYPFYNTLAPTVPVFELVVSGDGTEFFLLDLGATAPNTPLRIQNTDPLGEYTFTGVVEDVLGLTDEVSLTITFINAIEDLQANTALTSTTGTIADLTATFPDVIPPAIVDEPYQINSRMTLSGEAIPAGSTITIMVTVDGVGPLPYVTNVSIPESPFFVTELFDPDATPADFDANYGGKIEVYSITITSAGGNLVDLNGSVLVESIISKDGFTTNVVLDSIELDFSIPADEAAAIAYLQANTSITGNLEHLIATFPESIPQVIVDADYQINSRMTLSEALPEGSTVSIEISADGLAWYTYVTDVTLPGTSFWITDLDPSFTIANFDANYDGQVEHYRITVNGNPLDIDTFLKVESIISKDEFVTTTVLAELANIPVIFADDVAPVMVAVTPAEGLVTLAADETFILKVKASDPNLAELEIDHSFGGPGLEPGDPLYLPEFSVYASTTPWGDDDDLAMFTAAGVTVSYDATLQEWTIDFGEAITDNYFIPNDVTFYMVLYDVAGNQWGSMSPIVPDNTFEYTFEVTNTLDEEIESAPSYVYDPIYTYVGTRVFDDETNIYTVTYDDVDFNPNAMYDLARYLGALYRQDGSTVTSIVYGGVTYTWDAEVGLQGSNWVDSLDNTLVSKIVDDFDAGLINPAVGLVLAVKDGVHTENVTFKFVIRDTIAPEFVSGVAIGATGFDPVTAVDFTFTIPQGYTVDHIDFTMSEAVQITVSPFVYFEGVLYGRMSAVGNVVTVTPNPENVVASLPGTFTFTIADGAVKDLAGNAWSNEAVTLVVEDTIAPEIVSITANGAGTYPDVTAVGMTLTVEKGYTVETIDIVINEPVTVVTGTEVTLAGVPYGLVTVSADGLTLTVTPYPYNTVADRVGTFEFIVPAGSVKDLTGNAWVNEPVTLVVEDTIAPEILSGVAKSNTDGDVTLVDGAFTVPQGYVVDTIEITLTEPVLVEIGTVVTMVDYGPYGTVTAYDGALITITPTAGYETAALVGEYTFTVPEDSITDEAGNAFTGSIVLNVLEVVGTISWEGTGGVTPTIVGDTVTFDGEIAYYTTEYGPPTNGHWVGVQIDAPAGYDTVDTTFTINGGTPYTWDDVVDGDNFVWIYKLVSTIPQTTTIVVNWNAVSVQTFTIDVTETSTFELENSLAYLQANTVLSSESMMVDDLTATFPADIPSAIVAEDYVIDSRMTLAEALPAGTTVTVYKDGDAVLTDITLSGKGPFWFTSLFDPGPAPRAAFDANYGGKVEEYSIVVTRPGTNPLDFDTTVLIESVISKDYFATETVLDDITLGVLIPADEAAALLWLQANTVLSSVSGTIADLKATFPESIPPVIVAEDYVIDSRITLSEALPEGVTVTVLREGSPILTDLTLSGTGPFWFTELFDPDAERAAFDAGYADAIENYSFILNGAVAFDYSSIVTIESVISKDDFSTETVLDDIGLAASITATEAEALNYAIENTILSSVSGTIADLKATFPDHIPPIISDGLYVIDSRFTLTDALPLGTTVTVFKDGEEILTDITLSGTGPFWFTTLFDPDQPRASFDEAIYAGAIEDYVIVLTGPGDNPLDFDTTIKVESVLFKFGFATEIVLDEITLDVHIDDAVAPVMVEVLPIEGLVTLAADESFVMTVKASDPNLYSLEVDHSFGDYSLPPTDPLYLPEFTVYASATNPWGSPEAKAGFDYYGMTVAYDETLQKWTIDFGETITDTNFIPNGVTFYMVLHDAADNKWGSMSPTTDDNTYVYTFDVSNTLEIEIAAAPSYSYPDGYVYVGDSVFDDPSNTYTNTYTTAEFLAEDAMYDLARYLGALYRQDISTIIEITYGSETYTWDPTEPNAGSNWYNGLTSLVSVMVTDYLTTGGDLVITVSDGWHTSDVTFRLLITNTLDDEIESAPSYVYSDYTYVGTRVFDDVTNIYTVTYDDVEFNPNAMNDLARYLGALYRQDGSTVISIVYDGVTYTWDETGTLKGSNWEDAGGNTLVSTVVAGIGSYDPAAGLVFAVSDGVHVENVTFKFVILDTIAPEIVSITANGATGFDDELAVDMTLTVEKGYTVETIDILMNEPVTVVADTVVTLGGAPYGSVMVSADGLTLTVTPYPYNTVAGMVGTFEFIVPTGSVKDLAGNAWANEAVFLVVEDTTAPEIVSITAHGATGFDDELAVGMTLTVEKGYTVETIDIVMNEPVTVVMDTEVTLAGVPYGLVTVSADGLTLTVTPYPYNTVAGMVGTFEFVVPAGSVEDLTGNAWVNEAVTLVVEDTIAPEIVSITANGATGFDDVTAVGMTLTVEKGYTVETIDIVMSEPVTVVAGTEVTLAGVPYGLVTVSADGLTLTVTPYPYNTVADRVGTFEFIVPDGTVKDLAGNAWVNEAVILVVVDTIAPEILSGVAKSASDGDVNLVDGAFTVDQGYVVDTIDITMDEDVLVALGTIVTMVDYGPYGTITANVDGVITITPYPGFETAALIGTFTFTVPDGSITDLAGNVFTGSIVLNVLNVAPVAVDDTYTTDEDTPLTIETRGVLTNDTDLDPTVLTAVKVSDPANGTLVLNADGSFTYTPDADFFGTDTFTYKANDGYDDSNIATVTITVTEYKDQVIAVDDAYETDEDTTLTIAAPGVLANDIDVDLNNMTAGLVTDVENGTLSLNVDGSFVYVPDPDFYGTDSFVYQLVTYPAIQSLWTDEATVTITVHPVDDAPIVGEIGDKTVVAGETLTFTVIATDPEGEELTYSLVDAPTGAMIDPATGAFSWDTTGVEPGDYTFDVCVSDGENTVCETITVTVKAIPDPQPIKLYLPLIFR